MLGGKGVKTVRVRVAFGQLDLLNLKRETTRRVKKITKRMRVIKSTE